MPKKPSSDNTSSDATQSSKTCVLVVCDNPVQASTLCRGLYVFGHRCLVGASFPEAISILTDSKNFNVDVAMVDLTDSGFSGLRFINTVRDMGLNVPMVAIAGVKKIPEIDSIKQKNIPVLSKPFNATELDQTIRKLLGGDHA